jgi:hypothetical protein
LSDPVSGTARFIAIPETENPVHPKIHGVAWRAVCSVKRCQCG